MQTSRYARQILAFGEEGQRKIEVARVGLVGLGGMGSQVVQALGYLGVGSFVLIDDDYVDITNLNRLIGALPADADAKTPKVAVAARQIGQINSKAAVRTIQKNLRTQEALEGLLDCPVIFGCVDHDGPRLILMELAAAFEAIHIDSAVEIIPQDGRIAEFGGRVVLARPGEFCLGCAQQIDMERAKWELESAVARETRRAHGYGLGEEAPALAVVSLNGVIANLAVTEFLVMMTGIREPNRHLTYHALRGNVNIRTDKHRDDCFTCCYLVGTRERANIFRYVPPESDR